MRKLLLNPTPLFRKLRQLSMLLTLLLALPQTAWGQDTYGITIGRTPITSANKDDVFSDGKVSFTPATDTNPTNTLTLRGASIVGESKPLEHGITVTNLANLTIVCAGDTNSEIYSTSSPIFCTDASCDLTFTSEQGYYNFIQFDQSATELVDGFKSESYVAEKAEQFLPQKQIGFITYKIDFNFSSGVGLPSLNTKTRTFDTSLLSSANLDALSGGGFTFDPATCTLTILDGTRFGRFADDQLQQSAIYTEIQWGVDADLRVVINGDCQIIGGQHVNGNMNFTYYPFRNFDSSTGAVHTGRKISFEKGANATNANLALVGVGSTKASLFEDFAESDISWTGDLQWVSGLPVENSASISATYDITIETTPVTVAAGKGGITPGSGSGKVYYDGASNIMTLDGVNLNGPIATDINNMIIELKGENKINSDADNAIKRISSNETLNLTIRPADSDPLGSINLANSSSNLVDGFNVSLGGALFAYPALSGSHNSYITSLLVGSQMVAHTGDVFSSNSKVSFDNSSNTNVLTLSGVTDDLKYSKIISGLSNLTINFNDANTIVREDSATAIMSTNSNSVLTFTKATDASSLTISHVPGEHSIIHGFKSITYGDGIYQATSAPATYVNTPDKGLLSALDNTTPISSLSLSSSPSYQLWVAGTQATSTTSGTGWSYDAANNKLTLTNYTKADNDGHAFISNMANLNVYLVGTNSVGPNTNSQTSTGKAFYTTYTDATLTFSTDENNKGTLSASGYNTFCEGFSIYCNNGLGYYPSSREIKAKATPTIKFAKRDQTSGAELSPAEYVGASETLQTAVNSAFKAPRPEYDNHYQLFVDSTRYTYSYAPEGIVEIPVTATDPSTGNNTFGEMNILKAGTVTITCTYPGNLQNEACSASYTLQVNKADANLAYDAATSNAYIDLSGNGQWGVPNGTVGTAPTLTKPTNVTGITYTSSNTNVATISSTGDVTPIGAGEATITATLSNNDSYNDGNASYQLTVMVPATISFANATASVLNTATYTQAATTDPAGATIIYSSSNNDVNVNANGQVTINNPSFYGPVTITATLTAVPAATPQLYYVLADEPAFQATYDLTVSKVFNSVTFEDGQNFATYYNDENENMTVPEGLTAYLITGTSGNSVVTYPINYLPQNVPLLLEKSGTAGSTLTNTIYSGTELTDAERESNNLRYAEGDQGISEITSDFGGTPYILYKNEFVKASGTIRQNHCYLLITNPAPTRGYYSIGHGNDGSTAIDDTLIDNEETTNDDWYDLQGRRIQKPTKAGIYIVNGKKMIVK